MLPFTAKNLVDSNNKRKQIQREQEKIADDVATQKDAFKARKIHYDLRAYNDLRPDKTGRSAKVYDLCLSAALPLIAKTFVDEKGGANE